MPLTLLVVKAPDRPGLLSTVTSVIKNLGGNIVLNLGYRVNSEARLVFIVESVVDEEKLLNEIVEALGEESVEAKLHDLSKPNTSTILTDLVEENPTILHALEDYLAPIDIYDVLMRLPSHLRIKLYGIFKPETLGEILKLADPDILGEIVENTPSPQLSKALGRLDPEDIADVVQKLPSRLRNKLLSILEKHVAERTRIILKYPPESAGGIMTTNVLVAKTSEKVDDILRKLAQGRYEVRDTVVVVDEENRFAGLAAIDDILRARPGTPMSKLARKPAIIVNPFTDREDVAKAMLRYGLTRIPVVDDNGRFLGIVTIEDAAEAVMEEAAEDIALLGGLEKPRERYLALSILDLVKLRIPWLLLIYVIESITATIIKSYESLIARVAVVAAFIPLIMDTGGNVGSQASSMIVRALALGEVTERSKHDILYIVSKELATALIIGVVFALIGFGFAYVIGANVKIALAVSATLFTVIVFADLMGSMLPLVARLAGLDPATISSPLLTTIIDITVALIYMGLASILVSMPS